MKGSQDATEPGYDTQIEQAETRTKLANTRTEQANTRTEQAEKRTDQANTRTDQANVRTEEAEARTVEAIRASELRYRRLFETAQDGMLILDGDTGQVVDANPFMKDLLGYSQEEFLGRKLWEIGPFKGTGASKIAFAELQHTDRVRYGGLPLETKDGRRVEVEFISSAYLVDQKRLIQCNIRDISERKLAAAQISGLHAELEQSVVERERLEAQFIEVQKMEVVGQLAAGVAHDFNNILAVIIGYDDLITSDLAPDSPLQKYTEEIPGDYVMLSVSDTGTGITDEVKARLFEAFFTTKPKGKGTGLGLATCQTIVQQSGAYIDVYSEVGQGTTFKIYFPRVEQPLDVTAAPVLSGTLPRGTETLLVVEDDLSLRHLARGVLEAQGYDVRTAPNGQEALRTAREHKGLPIRLVITDVVMPQMGGKVMAEWLKTTNPDLKVLFTSGYSDDAISHHGVLEPGVEFLAKPYTPATLACKVRDMLDEPRPPYEDKKR